MSEFKRAETKRSIGFILSIVLHAFVFAMLALSPKYDPTKSAFKHQPKSEVTLMTPEELQKAMQPPPQLQGQIVEQDKQALNDEKTDTQFLSAHDQKVVKEEQAAVHGKFLNTDGSAGEKKVAQKAGKVETQKGLQSDKDQKLSRKSEPTEEKHETLTSEDGVPQKHKVSLKDLTPSFKLTPPPVDSDQVASGGGNGPSATDDHLKDVKTGMQTLLSTREFIYYSYYNRIKDRLRQYWEPMIKEKMEHIVRSGRTIASTDRVTRIVIVLDKGGTLVRVQIVGPSGVNDLDQAAVEAFRAAAPFPNPPKGIVDADGTIKIHWDFILEA